MSHVAALLQKKDKPWIPTWRGVVMIIRADASKMPHLIKPMAHVLSPIRIEYNARRAIQVRVDYSLVKHYFKAEDGDAVEVYAELTGENLTFHERASKAEFFLIPETGTLVDRVLEGSRLAAPSTSPTVH